VGLSLGIQNNSESYERILVKFCVLVGPGARKRLFNFDSNLDFLWILGHLGFFAVKR